MSSVTVLVELTVSPGRKKSTLTFSRQQQETSGDDFSSLLLRSTLYQTTICAEDHHEVEDPGRVFLKSLHKSISFLKSLNKRVHIISAGDCMICFGCLNETFAFGLNTVEVLQNTSNDSGSVVRKSINNSKTTYNDMIIPKLQLLEPSFHPVHIAVGLFHILVVDSDGDVWSVGQGQSGELGVGSKVQFQTNLTKVMPLELPSEVDEYEDEEWSKENAKDKKEVKMLAVRVYAGAKTSVIVAQKRCATGKEDTTVTDDTEECVYLFGSGAYYKLGHGLDEDELAPRYHQGLWQGGLRGIQEVACGRFHMSLLAKDTNDVYLWGETLRG